jgi:peptidoglycan/LPS O-acetylase OafA/YrhL
MKIPSNDIMQVDNNAYSIITNLFLIHSMNLHSWFTWVHASWSISTEWWAYMLFPFLVKPFSQLGAAGKIAVAVLCFVGYFGIAYYVTPTVGNHSVGRMRLHELLLMLLTSGAT